VSHLSLPTGPHFTLLALRLGAAALHATQFLPSLPLISLYTPAIISLHHASARCNTTFLSRTMANIGFCTAPSTSLHVFQTSKWLPGRLQSSPTKAVEPTTQLVSQSPHRSPSLDKSCRYAIHPLVRRQLSKQWPPSHASLRPATRGNHGRPKSWRRTIRSVGFLVATPKARSTSPLLTMSTDRSASRAPARFCKYDEFNHCAVAAHRVTTVFIFFILFSTTATGWTTITQSVLGSIDCIPTPYII
jgi:hypothetical protein